MRILLALLGAGAGVFCAFMSTRRVWLGEANFKEWMENLGQFNAYPALIGYTLIGTVAGGLVGTVLDKQKARA